jgi:hypothetical protein
MWRDNPDCLRKLEYGSRENDPSSRAFLLVLHEVVEIALCSEYYVKEFTIYKNGDFRLK